MPRKSQTPDEHLPLASVAQNRASPESAPWPLRCHFARPERNRRGALAKGTYHLSSYVIPLALSEVEGSALAKGTQPRRCATAVRAPLLYSVASVCLLALQQLYPGLELSVLQIVITPEYHYDPSILPSVSSTDELFGRQVSLMVDKNAVRQDEVLRAKPL